MVAAAIGGSAALSAGSSLFGASEQAGASNNATQAQEAMFNIEQQNLAPYMSTGTSANSALGNLTGLGTANPLTSPLLSPISVSEQTLQTTPGYQFNLQQGLKSVQNSAAARGLGTSGAALKGAASYATGLADSTYQNQFNNALTNQTNQFNRLMGLTDLGANAAAGVGQAAVSTGQGIASSDIAGGNALAAGTVGAGNAISSAYPNYLAANALTNLYGGNNANSNGSNNISGND